MENIAVVYWSGTGNTEIMANNIAEGIKRQKAQVSMFTVAECSKDLMKEHAKIAFGCPSMGVESLEESEFEPFFESIEDQLKNHRIALFGSYGWGDGEWMRNWQARVTSHGGELFGEGLIINETPDDQGIQDCIAFGEEFAKV
jgi:flavodoxin short chain